MQSTDYPGKTLDKRILTMIDIKDLNRSIRPDCIVFDLDGTLIFSSKKKKGIAQKISFRDVHGENTKLWIHKRPGFDIFLQKCFELTTVGIWSMGQPEYVEAIISLFPQRPAFVYNWCDCDRSEGRIFKRLDNIPFTGNIIMIDDKSDVLETCERINTLIIPEWNPSCYNDTILHDLLSKLF